MTLEDVLNRASQMDRAERWTLWTACGTHQPDSLPRTEGAEPSGRGIAQDAGPPSAPMACCGTRRVCLMRWVCERWRRTCRPGPWCLNERHTDTFGGTAETRLRRGSRPQAGRSESLAGGCKRSVRPRISSRTGARLTRPRQIGHRGSREHSAHTTTALVHSSR